MDVKTAFLYGDLDETILMRQPEGYVEKGKDDYVCKLKRSLYGLKQSSRQWNRRFDKFMARISFIRSQFDHCVYFRFRPGNSFVILLLYVDDILIASNSVEDVMRVKAELNKEFDMKDLGAASRILGIDIRRDRKKSKLCLSQEAYLRKILEKFGMSNSKPVVTPTNPQFKLSIDQCPSTDVERAYMNNIPYANIVGSLMYAMVCTRPDIAYAVSLVSRYMANPGKAHWQALKWILRYINGSLNRVLIYGGALGEDGKAVIEGYVDSDYAGCMDSRKSISGYVFTMFGTAISWKATLQKVVALSTTEAEYIALTEAVKEALWLEGFAKELKLQGRGITVKCDSQSAIHLSKNSAYHERTKHIDGKKKARNDFDEQPLPKNPKLNIRNRPLLISKYGNLESFPSHSFIFPEKLRYQGVYDFVSDYGKIYPDLVKEFYDNLTIVFGNDLSNLEEIKLTSSVRNKTIRMDVASFGNCLGIPTTGQVLVAGYTPEWEGFSKTQSFLDMIRPSQTATVTQQNPLSSKFNMFGSNFPVNERMLHFIIAYVLLPKHSNHSRVNEVELQVLYGVKNNIHINWAVTMLLHMHRLQHLSGGLPYSRPITHIMKAAGVNLKNQPSLPMTPRECEINDKTALKNTGIVLALDGTFVYKDDDVPPPIPEGGTTLDIVFNKLCSIETTIANHYQEQQAENAFFRQQFAQILQYHNQPNQEDNGGQGQNDEGIDGMDDE
ncbi:uncharacterized protein LOC131657627 [Vicia villosa]|uniref:uncharacterized protein LOC131657627 n=1 Tax=Vicia villosa TaxID=3911 RepID=UPI00273C1E3B|nr:uncharacterized protein LOC131657627 [Vicia villosa]